MSDGTLIAAAILFYTLYTAIHNAVRDRKHDRESERLWPTKPPPLPPMLPPEKRPESEETKLFRRMVAAQERLAKTEERLVNTVAPTPIKIDDEDVS